MFATVECSCVGGVRLRRGDEPLAARDREPRPGDRPLTDLAWVGPGGYHGRASAGDALRWVGPSHVAELLERGVRSGCSALRCESNAM